MNYQDFFPSLRMESNSDNSLALMKNIQFLMKNIQFLIATEGDL